MKSTSSSTDLSWYINRFRCMSIPEIGHRIQRSAVSHIEEMGFLSVKDTPAPNFKSKSQIWLNLAHTEFNSNYCMAADHIIEGYLDIFSHRDLKVGHPPNWNKNALSGNHSPMVFGKSLNYRDESLVGDIKYLWEPARHLHIVTLAQAYHQSRNEKYLVAIQTQISSWIEQCPYMLGPHWSSSLELAIRLINWSIVWQIIGGEYSPLFNGKKGNAFKQQWLKSIYQHMHFIKGHFSRFSSANNHLIGEAAGLFISTITWPFWPNCKFWNQTAKSILENETLLQNDAEGVNREQTTSYQQFVLDFLLLAGLAGNFGGVQLSDSFWGRLECMMEFISSMINVAGDIPMIGDADDGLVVRLSLEQNWNPFRSLLTIGAVLFDRADFVGAEKPDDKYSWLVEPLSARSEERRERGELCAKPYMKRDYTESGYFIIGSEFNTADEIKAVVDAGPIGYQSIAAHGHADALSIVLSYKGREFFIDPGTYSYHTKQQWRDHFRGTSAHNTIRVDGVDQSTSGGNFMWVHKAKAHCEKWLSSPQGDYFVGSHDGYCRLEDPVIHRRTIEYDKVKKEITITDRVECRKTHQLEWFWHLSEACTVEALGNQYVISNEGARLIIEIDPLITEHELVFGNENTFLGWVSRGYDQKCPTHTIYGKLIVKGAQAFRSTIKFL